MKLLKLLFFPGVPYPGVIIWHIILGSIVAAAIGMVSFGYDGHGDLWLPLLGSAVGIAAGAVVGFLTKKL